MHNKILRGHRGSKVVVYHMTFFFSNSEKYQTIELTDDIYFVIRVYLYFLNVQQQQKIKYLFYLFIFWPCMWMFLGQGSNPHHSRNLSHQCRILNLLSHRTSNVLFLFILFFNCF